MGTRTQGGRVRCAIAAGTLAAAVAGGSIFAAGAANADDRLGVGAAAGTAVGQLLTTGGTAPVVGTGGTTGPLVILPPVGASVPVTVTTGSLLSSTGNGSNNSPTSTSTTSSSSSPTTSTTSTGGTTTTGSGNGNGNSSTGTTSSTGGTSTTTTTNNSASSSSNSSSSDTTTSTTNNGLNQVQLGRSASTVYPAKDGYGDDITFDVRPLDATGRPVAVTGKAYLVIGGRIVKTWIIDGTTAKIVWDGLIDGKVVPGTYSFVLDVRSAEGVTAQSTSSFSVSGKKLVHRTLVVKRAAAALRKGVALPTAVSKNLAYGKVTVRASVAKKLKKSVRLNIVRTGPDRHVVIGAGKRTSGPATLPAASKAVKVVVAKQSRKVRTGAITLTYRYSKLG